MGKIDAEIDMLIDEKEISLDKNILRKKKWRVKLYKLNSTGN